MPDPGCRARDDTGLLDHMSSLAGTALVTGATAGIGLTFAHRLAGRGHDLVLVARDAERLAAVAEELRSSYDVEVEVLPADLVDRDQLAPGRGPAPRRGRARSGCWSTTPGFGLKGRFLDNDVDDEQQHARRAGHRGDAAVPRRPRPGWSRAATAGSSTCPASRRSCRAGRTPPPRPGSTASASGRRRSTARPGVRVMALCPGFTKTEFHQRMNVKRGTGFMWLEPDFLVDRRARRLRQGEGAVRSPACTTGRSPGPPGSSPSRALQTYQSIGRR